MRLSRAWKRINYLVVWLITLSLLLTSTPHADAAVTVITPVAMPGAGTYDRAQEVILYSYDSADPAQKVKITYKFQGREAIPESDYYPAGIDKDTDITALPKIIIDQDGILSVSAANASDASNKKYTQFRYIINPTVLSVSPGYYTDSVSGAVYSRVYIKFSRKMNLDKMSQLNFEVRQGNETAQLEKKEALGTDATNNQVYIDLLKRLDGDQDYKLTIVPSVKGALPDGSNAEVRDSDGKLFSGHL
ncbi:MAG: Ig-like domain-containing protein, partial [Bacillota bacterium]